MLVMYPSPWIFSMKSGRSGPLFHSISAFSNNLNFQSSQSKSTKFGVDTKYIKPVPFFYKHRSFLEQHVTVYWFRPVCDGMFFYSSFHFLFDFYWFFDFQTKYCLLSLEIKNPLIYCFLTMFRDSERTITFVKTNVWSRENFK